MSATPPTPPTPITQDKLKATDILVESIKLLVTIATIFFGGLLAYGSNVSTPIRVWSYHTALILFVVCSVSSVVNINTLIGKIYRSEADAIKRGDVKFVNIISMLSLLGGTFFGAIFLLSQQPSTQKSSNSTQTVISESQITVGSGDQPNIKVIKDANGHINEVSISPK